MHYDPAFVDLREFVKKIKQEPKLGNIPLIKEAADSLINALNEVVIMMVTIAAGATRGGLTIHCPSNAADFDSVNYVQLSFKSTNWYAFISKFISSIGGRGVGDAGDGLGFYDENENGQWDDMLILHPGDVIENANIELFEITGDKGKFDKKINSDRISSF